LTNGLIFSQEVLLALVKKGISREKSYEMVQNNAMQSWEKRCSFKDLLFKDKEVMSILSKSEIEELFNLDKIMININKIYKRIGLK
jgi:adenylosuccinate lyase